MFRNALYTLSLSCAIAACKKDTVEPPLPAPAIQLTTKPVTLINTSLVQTGGDIVSDGGYHISSQGVCYGPTNNPSVDDSMVQAGNGSESFFVNIDMSYLVSGKKYYVRAYAGNIDTVAYGNEVSFIVPDVSFYLGQSYEGGIIGYLDSTHKHGIIVAAETFEAEWGCGGTQILGANGTAIGTGYQNTTEIENSCPTQGTAADLCGNLLYQGQIDWYLPSKEELYQLYLNRNIIGGFVDDVYWSSSEHNNTDAWALLFTTGEQEPQFKSHKHFVRPVRSF